jgi:TetR/AcrR family transcriptional repressor of nem operon
MRRSRDETARTRRRAVASASQLFRERGIESVSLADVMAKLKMTAGGFYRHFESKEALAAEACAAAFASSGLARAPARSPEAMLRRYLSKGHRDDPSGGCPLPALASDMARQPAAVRRTYTEGVRDAVRRIREVAPAADPAARLALVAGLVGALAISRAVDDEKLSEAVLRDTRNFWISKLDERR